MFLWTNLKNDTKNEAKRLRAITIGIEKLKEKLRSNREKSRTKYCNNGYFDSAPKVYSHFGYTNNIFDDSICAVYDKRVFMFTYWIPDLFNIRPIQHIIHKSVRGSYLLDSTEYHIIYW